MNKISLLAFVALTVEASEGPRPNYPVKVAQPPTVSPFPFDQSPHPVTLNLNLWPEEVEWTITGLTE